LNIGPSGVSQLADSQDYKIIDTPHKLNVSGKPGIPGLELVAKTKSLYLTLIHGPSAPKYVSLLTELSPIYSQ
jgi:hypothetical protein